MATAKKITKVETPIDHRETFVSLRKNFADSELSVEEKLRTLYDLQAADSEIDKIMQLRGELPAEVAEIEGAIADLKAQQAEIAAEADAFTVKIAEDKQNIVDCENAIAKYQKQLETITNSREYDSLNKEIEDQELQRQIAEKYINEARMQISLRKDHIEEIKSHLAVLAEDLAAKKAELDSIVDSTAKEEAVLVAKRQECAARIDERTMSAYERIRNSVRNRLAVVSVYNNACGGCFNSITPQRLLEIASNKKLIICEHCGRILINPDFEK